jgi:Ran GTPase-activating protein (RanGAP) involved in mRNA processing and transport
LLQRPPSEELWEELIDVLNQWPADALEAEALPYARQHLARWPDAIERRAYTPSRHNPQLHLANQVWARDPDDLVGLAQRAPLITALMLDPGDSAYQDVQQLAAHINALPLTTLYLFEMGALAERWSQLIAALRLTTLTSLEVGDYDHDLDPTARSIAQNAALANLRTLKMTGPMSAAGARALASSPHLAHLTELSLQENTMGHRGALALANSPHLKNLKELHLALCQLGPRSVELLAASANMARLEKLDLHARIGARGARALADSTHLKHLKELRLAGPEAGEELAALWEGLPAMEALELFEVTISAACADRIAAATWPTTLHKLRLGARAITPAASLALAQATGLRGLRHLELHEDALCSAAILLGSPNLTALERLSLWDKSSDEAIEALCAGPSAATLIEFSAMFAELGDRAAIALSRCAALTSLHLYENQIGPDGAEALATSGALARVHTLNLCDNPIGPRGARALARSPHLTALRRLNLKKCGIDDDAGAALIHSDALDGLRWLSLEGNQLGPRSVAALVDSPWVGRLRRLGIHRNPLGDDGVTALARGGLLHLLRHDVVENSYPDGDLSGTGMTARGLTAVLDALPASGLSELALDDNPLGDDGIAALAAHPSLGLLTALQIHSCACSPEALIALVHSPHITSICYLNYSLITPDTLAAMLASPHLNAVLRANLQR